MEKVTQRSLTHRDMRRTRKPWREQEWEWKRERDPKMKVTLPRLKWMEAQGPEDDE